MYLSVIYPIFMNGFTNLKIVLPSEVTNCVILCYPIYLCWLRPMSLDEQFTLNDANMTFYWKKLCQQLSGRGAGLLPILNEDPGGHSGLHEIMCI